MILDYNEYMELKDLAEDRKDYYRPGCAEFCSVPGAHVN